MKVVIDIDGTIMLSGGAGARAIRSPRDVSFATGAYRRHQPATSGPMSQGRLLTRLHRRAGALPAAPHWPSPWQCSCSPA